MTKLQALFSILFMLLSSTLFARGEEEERAEEGFAEFAPLIAFGENILKKNEIELNIFADTLIGKNSYLTDVFPGIIYGITDNFSIYLSVPFSPRNKVDDFHSSGIEDFFIQFEWAFLNKKSSCALDQATLVLSFIFPTGSITAVPPTGFGSTSYFLGTTLSHSTTKWMFFTSHGMIFTTTMDDIKAGEHFLYEGGFGRSLFTLGDWHIAFVLELDGFYLWRKSKLGVLDPDSGGNLLYLTPSIALTGKKAFFQIGAGYPIINNLRGEQPRQYAICALNVGIFL